MSIKVHSVTNANVYVDGVNFIGQAKEIDIPEAAYKMVDHEALGMVGQTELFAGIEKMEATIMWNSVYPDAIKKLMNPNEPVLLQARASMRIESAAGLEGEQPVVLTMTARPKNAPGFNFKQQENVEAETKLNITAIKLEVNSEVVYEINLLANIFKIDGVDILANYKRNIG